MKEGRKELSKSEVKNWWPVLITVDLSINGFNGYSLTCDPNKIIY
jgi:hypothetical protein